jgi:hypothetical protein
VNPIVSFLPAAIDSLTANGVERNIAAPSSRRLVRHRPAKGAIDAVLSYRKGAGIEKAGKDPAIARHPQSIAAIAVSPLPSVDRPEVPFLQVHPPDETDIETALAAKRSNLLRIRFLAR